MLRKPDTNKTQCGMPHSGLKTIKRFSKKTKLQTHSGL
ncbi:hypothetical protein LEP1GSC199_1447 [Leptospira vanthielii serovar Holland str. Waz Holland = ATCC 700522]|uniref:Uncharacterized protein n=1 Tax=Leptospira vanthielii serovar Holland str. Waz Holland = ATCC 700522 TaxID=1218591 RepID=N1W4W0_9LEPT|nr:hypothetical protein LEP1GSC199_1447 [Leptospira vanthielii serovar Holland str. Waz Holland = ATCC 700522]